MSTIVISNIKATGETASRAVSGVAAAWANIDGTGTVNLRDNTNCSSVSDEGTGHYKLTFSANMSSANYSPVASGNISTTNSARDVVCPATTITTSQIDVKCTRSDTLAAEDFDFVMVHVMGDLA